MKNNGWITARPLKGHSSLNQLALLKFLSGKFPSFKFWVQFNFNLHYPFTPDPRATISFNARKLSENLPIEAPIFSFYPIHRWSTDIRGFSSMNEYVDSLKRWHQCTYVKSKTKFEAAGGKITFISGDWTKEVDKVFELYTNVAERHGDQLYDLQFFREAAKNPDYTLLCAWIEGKMIGVYILVEELPTLHSILCGFDYKYSKDAYAYSWMHYELIHWAIDSGRYENVDIGLSADKAKKNIGFEPTAFSMDLYAHNPFARYALKTLSCFLSPTIKNEKLKLTLKFWKK